MSGFSLLREWYNRMSNATYREIEYTFAGITGRPVLRAAVGALKPREDSQTPSLEQIAALWIRGGRAALMFPTGRFR